MADPQQTPYTKPATTPNTTSNYSQGPGGYKTGYATPTYNAPTGIPNLNIPQPTTKQTQKPVQQTPPVTAGKINKKPAIAESSIDFSALLWDQIK